MCAPKILYIQKETALNKISIAICAVLCSLAAVSCGNSDRGDGMGHMYDAALCGNPSSLDPQYASDQASATVIKNMYSGLLRADDSGNISCCNAASYTVSPDGLTYTFRLRKDNYWFRDADHDDIIAEGEYFPVKADDYVFAFQRLLDPKMQSPYAPYYSCIKNGEKIIEGSLPAEAAGVRAADDYTLEITLDHPSANFLTMLAASPASPCNKEFFESTKGTYGLSDSSVMSNGAFYMRQWFYDPYGSHNILYMRRCDINVNDNTQVIPTFLSFSVERDEDDVWQCLKDGDAECMTTLNRSHASRKYSVTSKSSVTLGLIFEQKNSCFRSEALRKALALSIDREKLADSISDDITVAYGIIPPAAQLSGRSYRELYSDRSFAGYDPDGAAKLFEEAKKELKTGRFDNIKIMVCANTVDSSTLHILSQQWQDTLGIYIGIEDVSEEDFRRRLKDGDFEVALYPLDGDVNTPLSTIAQFETKKELAASSGGKNYLSELMRCGSVSETVEELSAAECEILGYYGFVPVFYKNSYLIMDKDNEDIFYDPFTGAVDYRLAKNYS